MYRSKGLTTYTIGDFPFPFVKINCIYNRILYEEVKEFLKSSYPDSKSEYTNNNGIMTRFSTSDEVLKCGIGLEERFGILYKD